MPFYTLDDLRNEDDPVMHGAPAAQVQDQAQDRPAGRSFAGMGHRLDQLAPPMHQRPEERGRDRQGRNGARRARARSPSCDTCGYRGGGSDDDDDFDEDGQDLVLLLREDDMDDLQHDLQHDQMHLDVWRGGAGGRGEPLMIMEVGDGHGSGQPAAYGCARNPVEARSRGGEHEGIRGAGEEEPMSRRRRGGISGPSTGHGRHGGVQADPYGMGIGPASDWVDGRRRHGHAHGHDRGCDDYGRATGLFHRAFAG